MCSRRVPTVDYSILESPRHPQTHVVRSSVVDEGVLHADRVYPPWIADRWRSPPFPQLLNSARAGFWTFPQRTCAAKLLMCSSCPAVPCPTPITLGRLAEISGQRVGGVRYLLGLGASCSPLRRIATAQHWPMCLCSDTLPYLYCTLGAEPCGAIRCHRRTPSASAAKNYILHLENPALIDTPEPEPKNGVAMND